MVDTDKKPGERFFYFDRQKRKIYFEVEKRYLQRLPVDRDIYGNLTDEHPYPVRLMNLSGSGALLEIALDLKLNDVLELRLERGLPDFATVVVTRIAKPGQSYGVMWRNFYIEQLPKGFVVKAKL